MKTSTARIALTLLACSLSLLPALAQERALLWSVSGKDLKAPSYVYGTIHMIGKSDFFMTEATKKAFADSRRVTFEIDMDDMSDFSKLMPMLSQSFMKKDTSLQDLLAPEDYAAVKKHFEGVGLPMFLVNRIKPLFLTALDPSMMGAPAGRETITSYEMEFMEMAQAAKKPVEGLETMAFQMSIFDSIPYRHQAEMLASTVRSKNQGEEDSFKKLVQLYKDQDIEGMQRQASEDPEIAGFEQILLINRNRNWIPVMERMMAEKPTFFAVGAGHLGGENGVLQLLKAAGYSVEPIR